MNLSLRLTKQHTMKTYSLLNKAPHHEDVWGNGGIVYALTLALATDEWSASRHSLFTPGEKNPGTHWIRG